MKTSAILAVGIGLLFSGTSRADVLDLFYMKNDVGGGMFQYDFKLIVANDDGSYLIGQGFNWIIFGDVPAAESTLPDFLLINETFPNPIMSFSFSGGGHNGPTFIDSVNLGTDGWIPLGLGDFVTWSGTSTHDVPDGDLLFSTLVALNGATNTNFKPAERIFSVPEPSGICLLATLLGLGIVVSRRRGGITAR